MDVLAKAQKSTISRDRQLALQRWREQTECHHANKQQFLQFALLSHDRAGQE
jgi:hypothetical protein